jgi:uncharacterized protein (TIGR02466 family)
MKSEVFSLFPTPLYVGTLERPFTKEELDFVHREDLYKFYSESPGKNGGSDRYDLLHFPEMAGIKSFIQEHVDNFAKTVMCVENKLFPTISWLNRNPRGTDHYRHYHVNSIVSGVFYFTPNPAPIEFYTHRSVVYEPLRIQPTEFNPYNSNSSTVTLTQGTLILFPAYMEHAVLPNINNQDRISLAFNTWTKGPIGALIGTEYLDLDDPELTHADRSVLDVSVRK